MRDLGAYKFPNFSFILSSLFFGNGQNERRLSVVYVEGLPIFEFHIRK